MPTIIIPNEGLNQIAEEINDLVSHAEVGTGVTVPATTDTGLTTSTNRIGTTLRTRSAATFQNRVFFSNADLPATVEEAGFFMNGTGTPSSGQIVLHALVNFVKGNQDLLLIYEMSVQEG